MPAIVQRREDQSNAGNEEQSTIMLWQTFLYHKERLLLVECPANSWTGCGAANPGCSRLSGGFFPSLVCPSIS